MAKTNNPTRTKAPHQAKGPAPVVLPESVYQVLLDRQGTLWQVRAMVRALSAIADNEEARRESDISYGLDGVAALLEPLCSRMDPAVIAQDATAQEVAHG